MARHLHTRPRTTENLVLRPLRRRDANSLEEAVQVSLADLQPWLPWAAEYDQHMATRFIRESLNAWTEGRAYDFSIRYPDRPERHLGNVSIWWVSKQNAVGEIGYWIRSDETRRGIATEATMRILQVGFEELAMHKIQLRIAVGNTGSERIAEKLGFVREGVLREEVKVGPRWLDHSSWSLLESEWRATLADRPAGRTPG